MAFPTRPPLTCGGPACPHTPGPAASHRKGTPAPAPCPGAPGPAAPRRQRILARAAALPHPALTQRRTAERPAAVRRGDERAVAGGRAALPAGEPAWTAAAALLGGPPGAEGWAGVHGARHTRGGGTHG